MLNYFRNLPPRHRAAWLVAVVADAIQVGAFPFFMEGGLSPADWVVDLVAGAALCGLLGWHWAFLPTFAAELVPGLDLIPTWTAAVAFVTRGKVNPAEPEILPPDPAARR
jgi:hypothetical protein